MSTDYTIDRLIRDYAAARAVLDDINARAKDAQKAKVRAELALFEHIENAGLRAVRHELGLFSLDDKAEPQLEDIPAFVAWAENNAPELLIANRMRLGAWIREILKGERTLDHIDTPEGLPPGVGYSLRRSVGWRRS